MSLGGNCMIVQGKPQGEIDSCIEPMHASMQDLKNGKYCASEAHGQPGVIANVKMSKTGKHGHAKFTFNLSFPFTGQTSQEMFPGHTHLKRPIMRKTEWQVTYIDEENNVECIDDDGEEQVAFMNPTYTDKNGREIGAEFHDFYNEVQEEGQDAVWISVLEGPVVNTKGNQWVRQIDNWSKKAYEDN